MTQNLEDLIEDAKRLNPIEQLVAEAPGFSLKGHGRYLTTQEHDSLIIDTHNNAYFWNSRAEQGDNISWVQNRNGWDFKSAIEYLCQRAGLAAPEWGAGSPGHRLATRARQEVFEVAAGIFSAALWKNQGALNYAMSRGWTEETIHRARLGYTGDIKQFDALKEEIAGAIVTNGGDPTALAGAAVLGFRGDVRRWMSDHELQPDEDWISNGRIPGLVGRDMLIYPHYFGGRCSYFSGRGVHEKSHYQLPVVLAGNRQIYCNWEWSSQAKFCVIVEGQADAVSCAQWGYPAVALCGVSMDEHVAKFLGAGMDDREVDFYLGLDSDSAGNVWNNKIAKLLGPMTRIVEWNGIAGITSFIDPITGAEKDVKDANDLLRGMTK